MPTEEHIQRIIELHKSEAEGEYRREAGDDPFHDRITWDNIEPFLPREGRILDAGGGAGLWSIKMAETKNFYVVLLDITRELLQVAKRKIRDKRLTEHVEVLDADIRAIPHFDRSFDFVLCEGDPISICGNPEKAVSELSRVLKPNGHLAAGVDSTIYRVYKALSRGQPLDHVIEFLLKGVSPALEGALFDSKSFSPTELSALLRKYHLETVRIAGKPLGPGPNILDPFVEALPPERLQAVFRDAGEREKLAEMLRRIYDEPYVAGIGSHLHVVAVKRP